VCLRERKRERECVCVHVYMCVCVFIHVTLPIHICDMMHYKPKIPPHITILESTKIVTQMVHYYITLVISKKLLFNKCIFLMPFLAGLCACNPFLASLVLSCLSHFLPRLYTLILHCR